MEELTTKSIESATADSIQSRARAGVSTGLGLLYWLAGGGDLISPWWSKQRDKDLRRFVKGSDHLSGAFFTLQAKLTSIPVWVEARDKSVARDVQMAEEFTRILVDESEFGRGWVVAFGKFLEDVWTCDNGGFFEIIGPGPKDGPLTGPPTGLAHLDSWRCTRTSSTEYPVVYYDRDGSRYKLHYTRVAEFSQYASAIDDMNGVGLSWASRAINTAQNLIDIGRYKQEKLGSRPMRGILIGKGVPNGLIANALGIASAGMDAKGLSRFAQIPLIDELDPESSIELLDLASLPDGYDEQTATTLGMYSIALAGGVPPRWLWPATAAGATKSDAMFQHYAGASGAAGQLLRQVQIMLGGSERSMVHTTGKLLPPQLKLIFDFQDDVLDQLQADIQATRSASRQQNLSSGVTTARVERERMVGFGEITEAQFIDMELQDGRLPDGADVLTLFRSDAPLILELLALDVADPLDVRANDADAMVQMLGRAELDAAAVMTSAATGRRKRAARMALAALRKLRDLYERPGTPTMAEPDDDGDADESDTPAQPQPDTRQTRDALLDKALKVAAENFAAGTISKEQFTEFTLLQLGDGADV